MGPLTVILYQPPCHHTPWFAIAWIFSAWPLLAIAIEPVIVRNDSQVRTALASVVAGMTIKIAPGEYSGGNSVVGIADLTIEALLPEQPPLFVGGSMAWHFSKCDRLTLRHLRMRGQKNNGINLDDGGQAEKRTEGITLEHVEVSDIGPRGNHDGIKCSGLRNLTISECYVSGWGGQGIDLVGCHQSKILKCRFEGKPGFSATAGVQLKGGTADVLVDECRFVNAGERAINVGGSTGLDYFRPKGANYEARAIVVKNCVFEGSLCAAAFVGVDGGEFSTNSILFPEKWIFRILQETTQADFVPCRNVVVSNNRIVFRRSQVQTECNIGGGTEPTSFTFSGNYWFAEDRTSASRPKLPVTEREGHYGIDPR